MPDSAALLQQVVRCQKILGVIILDLLQRTVFPVLGFLALRDGISHLEIGLVGITVAEKEVAFQRADSADTDTVSSAFCVKIRDVLQNRAVIDAVVRVVAEVEAKIREIVFLFSLQGTLGFHVEAVTLI